MLPTSSGEVKNQVTDNWTPSQRNKHQARRRPKATLTMWTIYWNPADYPGSWVVRAHDIPGGQREFCEVCGSLEEARKMIPRGLICVKRAPEDELQIIETWT